MMIYLRESYNRLIPICLFALLMSIELFAQQPLNLKFEKQSIEGVKRPWGWNKTTWGATTFTMDSTIVKQGKYSLHSLCSEKETPCSKQSFTYGIEVFDLAEKQISISGGNVKGEGLIKWISCSINYTVYNGATKEYLKKEIISKKLSGTFDWKKIILKLKVPKFTTQFSWLDQFS